MLITVESWNIIDEMKEYNYIYDSFTLDQWQKGKHFDYLIIIKQKKILLLIKYLNLKLLNYIMVGLKLDI